MDHQHCFHEEWVPQARPQEVQHGSHAPFDARTTTTTLEYRPPIHTKDVCCHCGQVQKFDR